MDAIKIAKIEGVLCRKSGQTLRGTLHLTAHHLIFDYDDKVEDELWIPYPLISLVTRLPQTLESYSPIALHCRNFRSFTMSFRKDGDALDVFDSIKALTVASSVTQLYAFFYTPNPSLDNNYGWTMYSPREEFSRMGIGSRTKAWRFTDINKDYSFCPTYPARLVVPTRISDTTLQYAAKYRSKCRIPALVYLHWANFGTITRSSQPMVGLTNNRSIQDEKLIEAVFQSHHSPESRVSSGHVYGATATNLIIDARPTTNAMANVAKGAGTENMEYYKEGKKAYLGIDNIHVMRDSLNKVVETLREADTVAQSIGGDEPSRFTSLGAALLDRQTLRRSGWLRHLSAILDGTLLIVRNVHVNSSHVLIHCSDGWDRTAQLSSLAQLCLDPFYRTVKGFQILVEKDWLSFGHKFLDRCGHLSSEKFFLSATDIQSSGGAEAAQAFLASVQNKFVGQGHLKETSPVFHQFLECVRQIQRQYPERFEFNSHFLEQIHYHLYSCQFGTFLFNCERDRKVGDGGPPPCERTTSLWDFLNSRPEFEKSLNPSYDASLDDPARRDSKADMGVLFPNPRDVRFWNELYGRTDEEMNGKELIPAEAQGADLIGPMEGSMEDPVTAVISPIPQPLSVAVSTPLPASPSPPSTSSASISASFAHTIRDRKQSGTTGITSLTASMPELSQRSVDTKQDDNKFPSASSSIFSSRPRSPNALPQDFSRSPSRDGNSQRLFKQAELLQGGMKSVWGKLSSNASTAFTAVQGAYDGITKELKGVSLNQGWDIQKGSGGEMETRVGPPLSVPTDDWTTSNTSRHQTISSSPSWQTDISNPSDRWRTEGSHSRLSTLVFDNPWGTQRQQGERSSPRRADDIFSTSSLWADERPRSPTSSALPSDPTILTPPPLTQTVSTINSSTPSVLTRSSSPSTFPPVEAERTDETLSHPASQIIGKSVPSAPTSSTSDKQLDPLGVL